MVVIRPTMMMMTMRNRMTETKGTCWHSRDDDDDDFSELMMGDDVVSDIVVMRYW